MQKSLVSPLTQKSLQVSKNSYAGVFVTGRDERVFLRTPIPSEVVTAEMHWEVGIFKWVKL